MSQYNDSSWAAQRKRMAKERLEESEEAILEENEGNVENWAESQRSALARRQENESETMAQHHDMEREDLEFSINARKVEKKADAKRQIEKLRAAFQKEFNQQKPSISKITDRERNNSFGSFSAISVGTEGGTNPGASVSRDHLDVNSLYGDIFSKNLLDTLTGGADLRNEAPHKQPRSSTPPPISTTFFKEQTPATARRDGMRKTSQGSTPVLAPSTTVTARYQNFDNDFGDSSPLPIGKNHRGADLSILGTTRRSTSRRKSLASSSRNVTPLREHSNYPADSSQPTRKRSRTERFSNRQTYKAEQYKEDNPSDPFDPRDTVTRFGITFIGYNPTEEPEDVTLETSWRRNMFLDLNMNMIDFQFEPHDGIRSCASEAPLLVLDNKWDGKAFCHLESGRFEIYKKSGQRLRIQFLPGEIEDFIKRLDFAFNGRVVSSESATIGLDKGFTTERGPSQVNSRI